MMDESFNFQMYSDICFYQTISKEDFWFALSPFLIVSRALFF